MLSLTCLAVLACFSVQDAAPAKADAPDRAELERRFEESLSGARLVGHFTLLGRPDAGMQEDSYTIRRVSKVDGDLWKFEAVIEYGEVDVPVAMVLPVLWAGDTPVISVDDFQVPMVGTYSARVLIHGDQYAGTWMGKGYGGQMFGRVVRDGEDEDGDAQGEGEESGHGHGHGHGTGTGTGTGTETGTGTGTGTGSGWGSGSGRTGRLSGVKGDGGSPRGMPRRSSGTSRRGRTSPGASRCRGSRTRRR